MPLNRIASLTRRDDLLSHVPTGVNGLIFNGGYRAVRGVLLNAHLRFDNRPLNRILPLVVLGLNNRAERGHLFFSLGSFLNISSLLVGFVAVRSFDNWFPDCVAFLAETGFHDWLGNLVLTLFGPSLQHRSVTGDLFRNHFCFVRESKFLHGLWLHDGFTFQPIRRLKTAVVLCRNIADDGGRNNNSQ